MSPSGLPSLVRIRHGELERLRSDPRVWAAERTGTPGWVRSGFGQAARLAINHFHATGNAASARRYLKSIMDRLNLRNIVRRRDALRQLESYVDWCMQERPIVLARKLRIELFLGPRAVLCGEVSRVDLDRSSGGYRAILLGDAQTGWRDELRMPLLQRAAAQKMQRDEDEFRVGVQRLDGSGLVVLRFDENERDEAARAARLLVARGLRAMGSLLP